MDGDSSYSESENSTETGEHIYSEEESTTENESLEEQLLNSPNVYIIQTDNFKKRKIDGEEDQETDIRQRINKSHFNEKQKTYLLDSLKHAGHHDIGKTIKYIERVLKLPHVIKSINPDNLTVIQYMERLRTKLDKSIFGHNETKGEIIDYISSIFSNPAAKPKILALQSPPGCGKCLGYGTEVMMFDGSTKQVQDIEIGDEIMGDDSTRRTVMTLGSGIDMMYKISHSLSKKSYIVNSDHILCLVAETGQCTTMSVKEFLFLPKSLRSKFKGYSLAVEFKETKVINPYILGYEYEDEILENVLNNSTNIRIHYLAGMVRKRGEQTGNIVRLSFNEHKSNFKNIVKLVNSLGFDNNVMNGVITIIDRNNYLMFPEKYKKDNMVFEEELIVEKLDVGMYYGFTIDCNNKFVLGNYIVTHNTKFVRTLGDALGLPFQQISLGGLTDASILTGHDLTYVSSKPGKLYDAVSKSKYLNGIIYLDECDKIGGVDSGKFVEINGILTHLLDKEQNNEFYDNYIGNTFPIDLSNVFFVCSFNHEHNMDSIVLNRMKVLKIKESSIKEKIKIVKDFTIPEICKNLNICNFKIEEDIIKYVILHKCVHEPGLRNINKAFETLFGKLNTLIHLETATALERMNITKDLVYENVVIKRDGANDIIIDAGVVDKLIPRSTRPAELMMYI